MLDLRAPSLLPALLGLIGTRAIAAGGWVLYWRLPAMHATDWALPAIAAADLILLALSLLWLWRASRCDPGSGKAFALLGAAAIAGVWSLSLTLDHLARSAARPALAQQTDKTLRLDGTVAYLSGPTGFAAFNALGALLDSGAPVSTLVLDSPGGRVAAARGLARLVREAGLSTEVRGTCASACTLVFLAGTRRTLAPGARLGFHGYRLISTVGTLSPADEQARDARDMVAQGVAPAFAARALSIPHSDMWFPTRAELRAAGVLGD